MRETCHPLPKTGPLAGSLHAELKRCGKPVCRCSRGELHGPYWTRRWREGGRQRRHYVSSADIDLVRHRLDEWRRLHPPARSARDLLAHLRRLSGQFSTQEV